MPPKLSLVRGESPFDALMRAAEQDAEAAEGFALAYASMPREERAKLVDTVIADAEAAGRSPAGPLMLLLAVEEELDLAKGIANALLASEPKLARRGIDAGWVWGAETEGGVAVVRHLHGGFVELLRVGWEGTDVEGDSVPLAHEEELPDRRRALGVPQKAERVPLERAIDRLTEQLWRVRRRGGDLPERLRAYADLFRVSRHA